ncbi:MAG: response regulator transcription factor [Bacteriovoracaceae bacterium]|nr:response regulator transcription factor [Bacteroidota bacterium]
MGQKEQKRIVVWVVEDNVLFQKNIVELINDQSDMECEGIFASCEEAIASLGVVSKPDVILHDIGFERMNGITSVGIIKGKIPATQIIMFTVFEDSDSIFDALCAGATGYIVKSSSETMIIQSIHDVLAGGSPMNPTIARKAIDMFKRMHNVPKEYGLSSREREILEQIIHGFGNKHIAERFNVSHHTIDAHLRNIYEKLQVHSRTEAAIKALKERLV